MTTINTLRLINYRNFSQYQVNTTNKRLIAFIGPNGAGKTNILEAISLFAPGKGLRQAQSAELRNDLTQAQQDPWGVTITTSDHDELGTGAHSGSNRRLLKLNGKAVKSASSLAPHLKILWQVPVMSYILIGSSSNRRNFYDNIASLLIPEYHDQQMQYDRVRQQRLKILKQQGPSGDVNWLQQLEAQMAEYGTKLYSLRRQTVTMLEPHLAVDIIRFPRCKLSLCGDLESNIDSNLQQQHDIFLDKLQQQRELDSMTGRTNYGAHKYDFNLFYLAKNKDGSQCSTGEQKALIIRLLLAQALACQATSFIKPVILLDDLAAHFDSNHYQQLLEYLINLDYQIWLTSTEEFNIPNQFNEVVLKTIGYASKDIF